MGWGNGGRDGEGQCMMKRRGEGEWFISHEGQLVLMVLSMIKWILHAPRQYT